MIDDGVAAAQHRKPELLGVSVDSRTARQLDRPSLPFGRLQLAVRDALRVLQQRRREDGLKLKALRAAIKAGIDDLERGDFEELEAAELRAYMTQLGRARARRRR